jgi:hypothetical protein
MPPAMSSATAVVRDQEIRMAGLGKMGSRCVGYVTPGVHSHARYKKESPERQQYRPEVVDAVCAWGGLQSSDVNSAQH